MLRILSKYKIVAYLFLLISTYYNVQGQEKGLILSKYYSTKDYNAGTQNWCISQDERGVLYFGNSAGILEYDGVSWRLIPVPNNSSVRSLAFDNHNVLYAGAYNELGYLSPNKSGTLEYTSLIHLIDSSHSDFGDIWNINCFSDSVFFLTDNYIFRYVNGKFDYWKSKNERFYLSHKINNSYYVQEMGLGLLKFENDSLVLIDQGDFFADIRIHSILPFDDDLLICTRNKGLYTYDKSEKNDKIKSFSKISSKTKDLNKYFIDNVFYHGIEISDSIFALSTVTGNILIIDDNWNTLDVINNETIGIKSSIHYLHFNDKSLWIALDNGISKIEILSPFRFWDEDNGIHGTFTDIAQIDDDIYISTGSGIFLTNCTKTSEFDINSFKPIEGTFEQSWRFLYFQPPGSEKLDNRLTDPDFSHIVRTEETLLLISTSRGLFQLIDNKSKLISDHESIFLPYQYKKDPSYLFLGLANGIATLRYKNGKWKNLGVKPEVNGMVREIIEDTLGNLWLSANYKGVYKIENPGETDQELHKVDFYDTTSNLPDANFVFIEKYQDTVFFFSEKNYYTYNPDSNDFDIYIIPEDTSQSEELYENLDTLALYRLRGEILTKFYMIDYDNQAPWFGTTKGTCKYFHQPNRKYDNAPPVLIRKVLSNDSLIFNGTNYKTFEEENIQLELNSSSVVDIGTLIEYKDNALTFFFASPFFEKESENQYSYYLEGFDDEWSEWTDENKREYNFLREKEYTFKVKSKNIYNIESPIAEFKFIVLPPWYRTFGVILGYIILGIIAVIVIVKLYTIRLIKEKDKLEKIVIERTQEILMQKEEILVQSEHLKDANEGITAKNEELEKQKWEITNQAIKLKKANVELIKLSKVASETDNAIGIFDKEGNIEWVNDGYTRMYGYNLEQYKNEKSINIIDSSDNPNIKDVIKSCINNKKSVVYKLKSKTRDGKEIWAQTTLTHVVDKDGETLNLIAIDSDITEIKHAEKEIKEQRDKLALSNATKNKFFRIIAHDLRNPISTLAGSTNLIFNDFDEYDKEQTKKFIGELNRLSITTFNLLENLLDWSATQMGDISFTPKPIDLSLIAKENIELIKQKIDQKNINLKLNIDENTIAFADENMVKTIIRNLLSNAVKFTPEDGKIEISTHVKKDFIHCIVEDSGVGIQKDDLSKLFKVDQHYTKLGLNNEKGSGLGLILCKEFIDKNGGTINIKSKLNEGTRIEFTLKNHIT